MIHVHQQENTMKAIIRWTSYDGENGVDELVKEMDLDVIPRIGEELYVQFFPGSSRLEPDDSSLVSEDVEHYVDAMVTNVRWLLRATGKMVPEIYISDRMGLEGDEMEELMATGWKRIP